MATIRNSDEILEQRLRLLEAQVVALAEKAEFGGAPPAEEIPPGFHESTTPDQVAAIDARYEELYGKKPNP